MKTNKFRNKSYRHDVLLAVSGWGVAIFVSLLYLYDNRTPTVVEQTPITVKSPMIVRTDRVETLLYESRMLISRNRPTEAINRITTLWSVCHTTHQEVPEESHRIFAQAVSMMSQDSSPLQRPSAAAGATQKKSELLEPLTQQEEHSDAPAKENRCSKSENKPKPALTIPSPQYPLAKNDPGYHHPPRPRAIKSDSTLPPPPPQHPKPGNRSSVVLPPSANEERLPSPPPPFPGRPGGMPDRMPPPPPHERQSARVERRGPLESGTGGPPSGYLNY
jgi:hypothetical protein